METMYVFFLEDYHLALARTSPKGSGNLDKDFVQSQSQSDPRDSPTVTIKSASRVGEFLYLTMWRARILSSWRLGSSWPGLARALRAPARKRPLLSGGSTAAGTVGSEKTKTTALALGGGVTFALVRIEA